MTNTAKRIKDILHQTDTSVRNLSEALGVSNVSIYKWLNGKAIPEGENLKRFCDFFHVTPAYIIYGDGNTPHGQSIRLNNNVLSIPLLDVQACCGINPEMSSNITLIRMIDIDELFYNKYLMGANKRSLHVIHATGDSMSPTIEDGEPVIIDTSDKILNRDGIFAFVFNSGLFIKRVQCLPNGLKLISDNRCYDPINVGIQDHLDVVGRCYCGLNISKF